QTDVVHAGAALLQIARQARVVRGGLHQLYLAVTGRQKSDLRLLSRVFFRMSQRQAEGIAPEIQGAIEVINPDSDVIDTFDGGHFLRFLYQIDYNQVGGLYSPHTLRSTPQISPRVTSFSTAVMKTGIRFSEERAAASRWPRISCTRALSRRLRSSASFAR